MRRAEGPRAGRRLTAGRGDSTESGTETYRRERRLRPRERGAGYRPPASLADPDGATTVSPAQLKRRRLGDAWPGKGEMVG